MIRQPAVADQFYDGNPTRLHYELGKLIGPAKEAKSAKAVVAPHAGYMYSGAVAGAAYAQVEVPETVIILGPSHTGVGSPAALMAKGTWSMPMGTVPISEDLATLMVELSDYLEDDASAHTYEHSLEVQIPFLQYRQPNLSIVPVCLKNLSFSVCKEIGSTIAEAVKQAGKPVLLVASTDMTHYESQEQAEAKDRLAIDKILALDPQGLLETVRGHNISMCGVIPTTVVLVASLALGASSVKLIRYATSGDVTGDYVQVVGYASFVIE
ncbi:MAG: AmmeMemoRadiSam system protein B [Thermodesulfobacteriota bacterium]|nr:AmmeMemoRadiSam system protein B [Thermodesulfobacteriota bacterium]